MYSLVAKPDAIRCECDETEYHVTHGELGLYDYEVNCGESLMAPVAALKGVLCLLVYSVENPTCIDLK